MLEHPKLTQCVRLALTYPLTRAKMMVYELESVPIRRVDMTNDAVVEILVDTVQASEFYPNDWKTMLLHRPIIAKWPIRLILLQYELLSVVHLLGFKEKWNCSVAPESKSHSSEWNEYIPSMLVRFVIDVVGVDFSLTSTITCGPIYSGSHSMRTN